MPVETHDRRILAEVEVRLANWFKKIVPTVAVDCKGFVRIPTRKALPIDV